MSLLGGLIGAALRQTMRTGLNLLGFPANGQPAASGLLIILAIIYDR